MSSHPSERSNNITALLNNSSRLTAVDGDLQCFSSGDLAFIAPNLKENDGQYTAWDGHGVIGETAFSSGTNLHLSPQDICKYAEACAQKIEYCDIRGVFTCISVNAKTSEFSIALDPLCQYPLYIFQAHNSMVVSNNIYWIELIAKTLEHTIERSAEAGALEALFGVGAGTKTGFRQITLLPHNHMIHGKGSSWQLVPTENAKRYDSYSYSQLLHLSAQRLKAYMKALDKATTEGHLLFDLTGGQDSRLCFAAALGAGLTDIAIFSGGNDQSGDKRIAYQIAEKLGAKAGNYPENHTSEPVSVLRAAQTVVFRQQGHSNLYHYELGTVRLDKVCRVRGGAGELVRYFKAPPSSTSLFWDAPLKRLKQYFTGNTVYRSIIHSYWKGLFNSKQRMASRWAERYCTSARSYQRLFNNQFLNTSVYSIHKDLATCGSSTKSMGMDLYLQDRAKRHFGYISRALNMSSGSFEPLYDPVLYAAANALSETDRAKGRLCFDLIEILGGRELLEIPFLPASINSTQLSYLADRLGIPISALQQQPSAMADIGNISIQTSHSQNLTGKVKPHKNLSMHGTYLWDNRTYFSDLVQSFPETHSCWDIFNRQHLLEAITPNGYFFSSEVTATRGMRIFHTLIWLAKQEEHIGITAQH